MSEGPGRIHLLVVDDDTLLRNMEVATLRHAGFDVVEAACGEQALRLFERRGFDLLLLDAAMDGLDGYETCRRLRSTPQGKRVPVLMLIDAADDASIELAYEVGATDFISKPIQWLLLAHRVRYGLRAAEASEAMRHGRESLARAQRMAHMGSWSITQGGGMTCSDELSRIFGATVEAMNRSTPEAFLVRVRDGDRPRVAQARERAMREGLPYQLVFAIERFDGVVRTVFEQAEPVRDALGRLCSIEGITQDITERVEAEHQIRHLVLHDGLTGLPNRDFFLDLAEPVLDQARRVGALCAVLHLDVDRFKSVNDALGHQGGDEVLRVIADRLRTGTRGADLTSASRAGHAEVLARLGGNAFTLLLQNIGRPDNAARAADRLLRVIAMPIEVQGRALQLTCSIGIALFPRDAGAAGDLTRFSEQALYEAKKAGRARHRFFDEEMNAVASARLARETDLRRAVYGDELRVYLQPKMNALSGAMTGAEALVRWHHPTQDLVPPGRFIPLAEETGLILPLTDWMLEQVGSMLGRWAREGRAPLPVSVNVAAPSFMADGLVDQLVDLVRKYEFRPDQLILEVTESMLMTDVDRAIARLAALRDRGFKLSLDDFGTGYSSLSCVKRFPIDELKIDRSFVSDVQRGGKDGALVASIVTLGRMLDVQVVAEGVETEAQALALRSLGCAMHQGFLYARPMPVEYFEQCLPYLEVDAESRQPVGAAEALALELVQEFELRCTPQDCFAAR
jgi:diguanylate cyclase (GGDEF)-like protein/PAS domain S-box-containing protein